MSTIIMTACWPLQMSPAQKAVLVSMADNANDEGVCWPSVAKIAQRTCLSERAVQNAVSWLLANGYLRVSDRAGRSSVYQIILPQVSAQPPQEMHPRSSCTPAGDAPHPRSSCTPPPQQVHPTPADAAPRTVKEPSRNHQGTVIDEKARAQPLDLGALPQITPAVWADYLLHRKRKKAPLTQSAVTILAEQLQLAVDAGWTADRALSEAMSMGWTGLRYEWLANATQRGNAVATGAGRRQQVQETPAQRRRQGFMADMADIAAGKGARHAAGDRRTVDI